MDGTVGPGPGRRPASDVNATPDPAATSATAPSFRTTCPYCGVGCGVIATPGPGPRAGIGAQVAGAAGATCGTDRSLTIAGDPDHPANFGRLCSKGTALGETVGLEGRLLTPRIAGQDTDWDTALDLVAERFTAAIRDHGPDAVAFYVSGQMLTEDYYVANKLMKGFIGSANIDTNSRLCMASSVAGHKRAFGTDTVPGLYEDLDTADLVVLAGSNLAWCHPVLYQRLVAAKAARPGMRVVVVDPRRTATCDLADLHLPIAPDTDAVLFNLLLAAIADRGMMAQDYVARHVAGYDAALACARATRADALGIEPADLETFLRWWTATERVVTVYSQGINQSSSGSDKVNAIINCHLATGRIGRPGMGPFSVTGQPNAMGGREVGGMANTLACHLDIENPDHRSAVAGFWKSPAMAGAPGMKAVDMFRAAGEGRIKALWIIGTNPAVSMPDADSVASAISACDFVVVSDMMAITDTTRLADVLLPATGWGEKDGTVTNSERRISRQRRVFSPPGMARDDWRILSDVAGRMGWTTDFAWPNAAAVFAEHAALSAIAAGQGSDFDISEMAEITLADYDAMDPFVWPRSPARSGGRFFGTGGFHTPDGRGRMLAIAPRPPRSPVSAAFPFRLNTGRVRDHWHTMTRTGLSHRLSQHIAEPFLDIHPEDAARIGVDPASLAEVAGAQGRAVLRVRVTNHQRRGEVFAAMHWTGETAAAGRIGAVIAAEADPVSGQPALKAAAVNVTRYAAGWYGFAVSARDFRPDCAYWAVARTARGLRAELAGEIPPADWLSYARALFGLPDAAAQTLHDPRSGIARIALAVDGLVVAALFAGPDPVRAARDVVAALPGTALTAMTLAGRAAAGRPDAGATLCACFGVGINSIRCAIAERGLASVEAVGAATGAGSNCGSCRPEIRALLAIAAADAATRNGSTAGRGGAAVDLAPADMAAQG